MKKTIMLIAFVSAAFLLKAQVTLQPLIPQVGAFQKSQLWNMLVVNNNPSAINCYLVLSLQDRESGNEVLSATSPGFLLDKGAKQLNAAVLTPIQYSYVSFTGDKTDDFLSVGSYTACYKLMGGEGSTELAEACVPFDVAPLSPPILITPADSSILQVQPAMFTWQPPAPLVMFQQLQYEIVIAEILPVEKPEEAIELNAPIYTDFNIPTSVMNYTGAYPSLEKGKWYAWQVVAQDGQSYAAKTPVWDFTINLQAIPSLQPANGDYILLKSSREPASGMHTVTGGVLGIKYYSFDKAHQATIRFTGPDGNTVEEASVQLVYGDNFLGLSLDKAFKKGIAYTVEITDNKKNKSNASFILK